MKSIKLFIAAGAIGLLGMAGLSSCKQNNNPESPENYNGQTVKSQLLISIADNGESNALRMPSKIVQEGGLADFRGLDSIRLLPFSDAACATRTGKTDIKLNQLTKGGLKTTTSNAAIYENVQIPLGTQYFLFYAHAIDSVVASKFAAGSDNAKHFNGLLEANYLYPNPATTNKSKDNINFSLVQIQPTIETSDTAIGVNLATYMASIANAQIGGGEHEQWSTHSQAGILALYENFIKMKAGSSHAVLSAVTDLYNSLKRYQAEQVADDGVVNAVITAILTKAEVTSTLTATHDAFIDTLDWKSAERSNYANYPDNIDLPEGAATISWHAGTKKFYVGNSSVSLGSLSTIALTNFVYPPSLMYYAKSAILTSDQSEKEHYTGDVSWWSIKSNYDDGGVVKTSTSSVAIADSINYGVGLFKSTVAINAATMKDSKNFDRSVNIALKGLLIGGQKKVKYDFTQDGTADPFTLYDNFMNGTDSVNKPLNIAHGTPVTNHTLVLSTADNSTKSDKVYVALELVNNGAAFFGVSEELIPTGGTFYLVGTLDVAAQEAAKPANVTNHPAKYNIFYKDYTTTANFTIKSLANAYYTIPDLRTEGLELGFSVDLAWTNGMIFDIDL